MGFISDIFGGDAADAAKDSANIQADAQREALQYLKEREAIPQQFREGALGVLGGLYGLEGGDANALQALQQSPMYQAILNTRDQGEEAILRNMSATGGLRSGNASDALAGYNIDLQNQALTGALGGVQGLAQLPSNANTIAGLTQNIGTTLAQGNTAAAQAQQAGTQDLINIGMSALSMFSDIRLKKNIVKIGKENGYNVYSWDWNEIAESELGLTGSSKGVLADEVEAINPSAVKEYNGYKTVDYSAIGVQHG